MPTLVNYSGENEVYHGKLCHPKPVDSNTFCSTRSYVDLYRSPPKRRQPFSVWGNDLEQENRTSMDSLPDECLFEIFRRTRGQERSACACVSKRWLGVLGGICKADICSPDMDPADESEDGLLSRFFEGKEATDLRLLAMAVGTANRGGLGKLSVRGCSSSRGITDTGLSAVARGCPDLRALSLYKSSSVGDKGLSEIAKGCPRLKRLDLSHCQSITNVGLIAIAENCPNLSTLTIESCSRIGNDGLQAIAQRCGKLEMISIKDCRLIGDQGIASLSSSSSLTKLKLNGLSISDFSVAVIGHYGKSIVHLSLSNLKNVSEKGFWIMGNARGLQSLMSLEVTSCFGFTDQCFEAIGKGCPALKQICLRKCCFMSDQGLVAFSMSANSLESLHLEEISRVSLSGVITALSACHSKLRHLFLVSCVGLKDAALGGELALANRCRSLRSLTVQNCPGFGSAGLTILGKMCPEPRLLDLSGLYGVTDEGLLSLLKSHEGALVKLKLRGCLNLSDEVIKSVVKSHGGTIKTLSLEGCRKLTDVSLVAIAEHCQLLEDLDMSFCAITDFGLAALSSAKQLKLEILALPGCRGLSDKSVPSFIKMRNSLIGLNLQHCNSMSYNSMDLLTENLWRCDFIY